MSSTSKEQTRWLALVSRDRSTSKDTFVYAVRTTKIYCRPSCPSRLARRANIEFYDTPEQAENGGYRACKRCKPQLKSLSSTEDSTSLDTPPDDQMLDYAQHKQIIHKACRSLRENGGHKKLKELASEAGLTPSHFHRVFKKVMGVTPGEFGKKIREEGALEKQDYVRMVDEAFSWVEADPKNLEAISELSSEISRRDMQGGPSSLQIPRRSAEFPPSSCLDSLGESTAFSDHISTAEEQGNANVTEWFDQVEFGDVGSWFGEASGFYTNSTRPTTPDLSLLAPESDMGYPMNDSPIFKSPALTAHVYSFQDMEGPFRGMNGQWSTSLDMMDWLDPGLSALTA